MVVEPPPSPLQVPDPEWFARDVHEVAVGLLGAELSVSTAQGVVTVRLTEVEAYAGAADPGSHAFRGRTARNATMFGPPGHLYLYFTYGMHWCANVVTGQEGTASGVLLRAGEVVAGQELARLRRPTSRSAHDLASGPARLAKALGLGAGDDGTPLLAALERSGCSSVVEPGSSVGPGGPAGEAVAPEVGPGEGATGRRARLLVPAIASAHWRRGPRTGVSGIGGDGDLYPWRYWIWQDPTVSRYRSA